MKKQFRITKQAKEDLYIIWHYIAQDNIDAADRLMGVLEEEFDLIARTPGLGRRRDDIENGLRSFPVASYHIFYTISDQGVKIARVLSGFRKISDLF